ncbi:MAG: GGDEF domain-containing protein [Gammaproteobacteria bacterium]|nr:GGDEF domain-containing protein [Gammaproteobacteria bacterium]
MHAITRQTALTARILAQQFLFEGERADLIDWLLPHCQLRQLAPGCVLLTPKQTADRIYLILQGEVEVRVGRHGGQLIATLGSGQCVGEMSVIEGMPPSAEVIARGACTAITIEGAALRTLLDHSQVFARNLLRLLSRRLRHDNQLVRQSLESQALSEQDARRDPLTGLHNRRWLNETLPKLIGHRGARCKLCLLMLDIDHFKRYNDSVGHIAGDQALIAVANTLEAQIRDGDQAVRFGGEEFLVVLPDTNLKDARPISERLRHSVQQTAIFDRDGDALPSVTLSIGLAEWAAFETPEQLIARADAALYQAKHQGRNRVALSPAALPGPARLRRVKNA